MQPATRQVLVRLHRWLGLSLGAWFVMLGLTGSLLVYQDELDRWLNPTLFGDTVLPASQAGPERIMAAVQAAWPSAGIERIRWPSPGETVFRVQIRERGELRVGSPRREVLVGAVSARILGDRALGVHGLSAPLLMRTLHDLHHRILLGNRGKTAVGVVGVLLFIMIGLGLVIAWPRRTAWSTIRTMIGIRLRSHSARLVFDLHRSIGVMAFALLAISTSTGFALAFPDYARDLLSLVSPVRTLPVARFVVRNDEPDMPVTRILEVARQQHPGGEVAEIHLPARRASPTVIYLRQPGDWQRRGDTLTLIDSATAEVKLAIDRASRTTGEAVFQSLLPVHHGVAWGEAGRLLMCLTGLLPSLLAGTGILIWWRKRKATNLARQRRHGATQL